MTPKKQDAPILGRAMLVNVCVGMWTARKHDQEVTDKVNDELARNRRAGRYWKRLFGGEITSHSALVTAAQVARRTHYKHTLPWEDSGWRILPTANYFAYTEAMRDVQNRFENALETFISEYPKLVQQARERLGKMYRKADYPSANEIRRKFHIALEFSPLPASSDFRLSLPEKELTAMSRTIEDRVSRAVKEAMSDIWTRLGDAVVELREKLDDGKYLRDTMISRVGEVAEILGRLNVTEDQKLEQMRKKVIADLASLDVHSLKEDDKVRETAAKKADAILKQMAGVYSIPKKK